MWPLRFTYIEFVYIEFVEKIKSLPQPEFCLLQVASVSLSEDAFFASSDIHWL